MAFFNSHKPDDRRVADIESNNDQAATVHHDAYLAAIRRGADKDEALREADKARDQFLARKR